MHDPIHAQEKKVLRAAARAQIASGLAVTVHVHAPGRRGNEVLDILIGEGVKPDRIILDHIDASLAHLDIEFAQAMDYILSMAERGCFGADLRDFVGLERFLISSRRIQRL